ncbi:hypothetical protein [Streptomyces sp. NPDC002758]
MSTATLAEGDPFRGITIKQPDATCIAAGAKTIENRPRAWSWRGWVLLHAGQAIDRPAVRVPLIGRTISGRELVTGAWHLVLADVQELALPVPADGHLGPWKPSPDLVTRVFQQLPAFRP